MKQLFGTLLAFFALQTIEGQDYKSFTFEMSDGSTRTISIEHLVLTFRNGSLQLQQDQNSEEFKLADLRQMYFTGQTTAIDPVSVEPATDSPVEVYSIEGIRIGVYATREAAQQQLPQGLYVIRNKRETYKMLIP